MMKKYYKDSKVYSLGQLQQANISVEDTIELEVIVPIFDKEKQRITTKNAQIENKTYTYAVEDIVCYAIFSIEEKLIEATKYNTSGRYAEDVTIIEINNLELLAVFKNYNCYLEDGEIKFKSSFVTEYKEHKKTIIKQAKKLYQNRSVPVEIDGTTYTFFGGKLNGEKYEDALNTALRLGMTEGTIKVEEGFIVINKENMDKALGLIGLQGYRGWKKEQYYIETINNATTIEEIEAIAWEDNYSG